MAVYVINNGMHKSMLIKFLLVSFICLAGAYVFAEEPLQKGDSSVKELIIELYNNYEVVDKALTELKEASGDLKTETFFTPLTISVKKEKGFKLISVDVSDNGAPLWSHIYTAEEDGAMDNGARHQLYKGAVKKGEHSFLITYQYQLYEKEAYQKEEVASSLTPGREPVYIEFFLKKRDGGVGLKVKQLNIL